MITVNEILNIVELGLKPDGTFYSDQDKAEMLWVLFDEESKKVFDRGWHVGYTRGERDDNTPSGW